VIWILSWLCVFRFVEYNDERMNAELMCHKPVSHDASSVFSFKIPPKLPKSIPAGCDNGKLMQFVSYYCEILFCNSLHRQFK
jgi:hypothetical protein